MKLSIVATLYNSEDHVSEFCQRATTTAQNLVGDDYEIVLVNDGSPDNSLNISKNIADIDERVKIVDLSRNFGHHKAMMTGLSESTGEQVFLIDSDLEEEPEWLTTFSQEMENAKSDVIYGVQEKRKGKWFERWTGQLFYFVLRLLTQLHIPNNIVVARLMSRRYVNALLQHRESEMFLAGLWAITGFSQESVVIQKGSSSKSTYTIWRKLAQLANSITSFTSLPLVGIFVIGCVIFVVSCLYVSYLVVSWLFFSAPPTGYTSLIASVWLLGGLNIAFIGVVGIYLAKVFVETKGRPYTIVRERYSSQNSEKELN